MSAVADPITPSHPSTKDNVKETEDGTSTETSNLRFTVIAPDDRVLTSSGHYLGQACHNHVLTEVYMQLDDTGAIVAFHTLDTGSC